MTALVPELGVRDCTTSLAFYRLIGFGVLYDRPEDGFVYLRLGAADLMLDQIDLGRTFDDGHGPKATPFGKGVNLQVEVPSVTAVEAALKRAGVPLLLPLETRSYRVGHREVVQRQLMVADPDGYLIRPCTVLTPLP